jgi:cephalosporin hydroxylase
VKTWRDDLRLLAERGAFRLLAGERPSRKHDADGNPIHDDLAPPWLHAIYRRPIVARTLARHFNRAYYYSIEGTVYAASWLGVRAVKYPTDMWVYQELIHEQRPDLIIETGTYLGGSALFMAHVCEQLGSGSVVSIDLELGSYGTLPDHRLITYLKGSSTDPAIVERVASMFPDSGNVMVILDSLHTREHVLAELNAYAPMVPPRGFLVVEDTNVNGHPVLPRWGPGPMEAVDAYLAEHCEFAIEPSREKFMLTSNPRGFLRRTA